MKNHPDTLGISSEVVTQVTIYAFHNQVILNPDTPEADPEDIDTWPIIGFTDYYRAIVTIGFKRLALDGPHGLTEENYLKLVEAVKEFLVHPNRPSLPVKTENTVVEPFAS